MNKLLVIKIGGNVLDDAHALKKFLHDFSSIEAPKILVHGGGKIATRMGEQLGIQSIYNQGRRITDRETLDLVTMVYGGLVNKQLVASLQQLHCNALGLTGADGNAISAIQRPVKDIDYGFVGDITPESVNTVFLNALLEQNIVPVFAPLTHAGGNLLNTNADTIASVIAVAMSKQYDVRLVFCFDKKGVLGDVNDQNSVIPRMTKQSYDDLLGKQVLADGILPKLENAYGAINEGVKEVLIGDANDLLKNMGAQTEGTLITL